MLMMTSQILKSTGFTKTNLDIPRAKHFLLILKKFINYTSSATYDKEQFCSGGKL